jgi:hypothetical protein
MRRLITILSIMVSCTAYGQKNLDIGLIGGGMYYLGDLNTYRHFYHTHLAGGVLLRYNFNSRYSLRGHLISGSLSARDSDFPGKFQKIRNRTFQTPVMEVNVHGEYNFFPYSVTSKKNNFTPYVFVGANFFIASYATYVYQTSIPFGIGFKVNLGRRVGFGGEWGFRKTFTDYLDDLSNRKTFPSSVTNADEPYYMKQRGYYHMNDWYSFAGLFLSFRIKEGADQCDAYKY